MITIMFTQKLFIMVVMGAISYMITTIITTVTMNVPILTNTSIIMMMVTALTMKFIFILIVVVPIMVNIFIATEKVTDVLLLIMKKTITVHHTNAPTPEKISILTMVVVIMVGICTTMAMIVPITNPISMSIRDVPIMVTTFIQSKLS